MTLTSTLILSSAQAPATTLPQATRIRCQSTAAVEYVCPVDGDDDDDNDDGSGSDDVPFTLNEWKTVQAKGRKLQSAPSSPPGLASSPWSAPTTTVEHRNPFEALVTKDDQTDDDGPLFGPRRTQTVDVATTPLTERNISVMAMTPPTDDPWSATGSDPWSPGTSCSKASSLRRGIV